MIDAPARSARILIVEDSDVQALELRAVLESHGYHVDRVAKVDATQANRKAEQVLGGHGVHAVVLSGHPPR